MGDPKKTWGTVRARFERLKKAASWPSEIERPVVETEAARNCRLELENSSAWKRVYGAHDMVKRLGGTTAMTDALELVAYKVAFCLALSAGALRPNDRLATSQLSNHDGMLIKPLECPHLPPHTTVVAEWCDPETFREAVESIRKQVYRVPMGQQEMVLDWALDNLEHWPTAKQVMRLEHEIVEATCRVLEKSSRRRGYDFLIDDFEMSDQHAGHLMRLCQEPLRAIGRVDRDLERGLMITRTEDLYRRSRRTGDRKSEANALKILATITGLTQPDTQQEKAGPTDLAEIILKVEAEHSRPAPAQVTTKSPGPVEAILEPNEEGED